MNGPPKLLAVVAAGFAASVAVSLAAYQAGRAGAGKPPPAMPRQGRVYSELLPLVVVGTTPENLDLANEHFMKKHVVGLNGRWSENPINEHAVDELRASGKAFTLRDRTGVTVYEVDREGAARIRVEYGVNKGREGYVGVNHLQLRRADGRYPDMVPPAPVPRAIDINTGRPVDDQGQRMIDHHLNRTRQTGIY